MMKLSKKSSRLLGLAIIVGFFVVAQMSGRSNNAPTKEKNMPAPSSTTLPVEQQQSDKSTHPDSQFELKEFRRSSVKDGKKVWEVIAERGTYDPTINLANLYGAKIEILKTDIESSRISADHAEISLIGTELKQAKLDGNVVANLDSETNFYSEQAIYNLADKNISTDVPVKIVNPLYDIHAQKLSVDTEEQIMTLTGQVKTLIYPSKEVEKRRNAK